MLVPIYISLINPPLQFFSDAAGGILRTRVIYCGRFRSIIVRRITFLGNFQLLVPACALRFQKAGWGQRGWLNKSSGRLLG